MEILLTGLAAFAFGLWAISTIIKSLIELRNHHLIKMFKKDVEKYNKALEESKKHKSDLFDVLLKKPQTISEADNNNYWLRKYLREINMSGTSLDSIERMLYGLINQKINKNYDFVKKLEDTTCKN